MKIRTLARIQAIVNLLGALFLGTAILHFLWNNYFIALCAVCAIVSVLIDKRILRIGRATYENRR